MSAARLALIGTIHVPPARRAIAAVDRSCGGRNRIQAPSAALARRCDAALTALSTEARAFARAIVLLRAPVQLEPLVADTIDAAQPIIDVVSSYRRAECLAPAAPRSPTCAQSARDLGTVITEFEQVLGQWPAGAGPT